MGAKQSIMKVAVRLFAQQGYEATTTLQVAKEVGVTEPTVFYHYKNKSHFFNTILKDASQSYFEHLDSLEPSGRTAFECISDIIRDHFLVVADEPEYIRILLRTCPVRLADGRSGLSGSAGSLGPISGVFQRSAFRGFGRAAGGVAD